MADLPPAARGAALEQSRGAELRSITKEIENGKTRYEIETVVNGHSRNVEIDSSGRLLEVEEEVSLASIPEAARVAIKNGARGAKILKIESVTQGSSAIAYEAAINRAGNRSEIRVDSDGRPAPESD